MAPCKHVADVTCVSLVSIPLEASHWGCMNDPAARTNSPTEDALTEDALTDHPLVCPHSVRFEVMRMWWRNLAFMHWSFEPSVVQALLPDDLTVDTWDGSAWVGLVPFEMEVQLPGGIPIPREGRFPETNVRTYVRGPDGTPGVWFMSLEAARLSATSVARATYGLPYFWASMSVTNAGPIWAYQSSRKWPGPRGASHESAMNVGGVVHEQTPFEQFLTARWGLFSTFAGRTLYAPIWHEPWELRRAELLHLDDALMDAGGVPIPDEAPVLHWTKGVEVRVGRPRLA